MPPPPPPATPTPAPPPTGGAPVAGEERRFIRDARWWPAVAGLVRALAPADDAARRDLRRVQVIVPRPLHAALLREVLATALGGAYIAPQIQTLDAWAGLDDRGFTPQRAELFEALRGNAWVRERFGAHAGALWALARDVALLGDELTLAAGGAVEHFTGRWRAAAQRHFSRRALAAGEPQTQLVLSLWLAGLDPQRGALRLGQRLAEHAARADGPLVWLLPQAAAPWQRVYAHAYQARSGHPAILVLGDDAGLAQAYPVLGAAWPELAGETGDVADARSIAERAAGLAGAREPATAVARDAVVADQPDTAIAAIDPDARPQICIWRCNSLEDEACAAAAWTVDRVREGCTAIALVAQDRLAARRVRALLDRAGVAVADEAGWKLSTTSAAGALMRWIDIVIADFAHADLMDWLQSPFTLGGRGAVAGPRGASKAAAVACIGAALLADDVQAGASAVRAAVARRAQWPVPGGGADAAAADALHVLDTLIGCARPWQQAGSLGRFLGLLEAAIDALGMRAPLAADPVGAAVLEAVAQLREQLAASSLHLEPAEFRAFLAAHFEEGDTGGGAVPATVVMTSLAATRLRRFDAALLIGADADHLPGARAAGGLLSGAVRRDLGLATDTQREAEQLRDLASLVAQTPRMAATWRQREGDAPRALSPWLARLALVNELSGGRPLVRDPPVHPRSVAAAPTRARAPRAPGRLPSRLSATGYQDLVDCPYRFFALRVLGLREAQRLRPLPDKRDLGKVLHRALYEFHRDGGDVRAAAPGAALPDPAAALRATIDALFAPLLRQQPALIGFRQRLRRLVPGYLQWLRADARDGWHWRAGEVALEKRLVLAPETAAGAALPSAVTLFGRLDRIDAGPGGARILDFKARDAGALRREQKDPGEAVQLLFYGLLLEPPAETAAYLSLQPPRDPRDPAAGVATRVDAPAPFAHHVAVLEQRLGEDLVRIAGGAPLAANGAESVCRRCELRSLCRHGFADAMPGSAAGPRAGESAPDGVGVAHE